MATVAAKVLEQSQVPVVENGIVRSTVFPNNLRQLRRDAGYEKLKDFLRVTGLKDVNYTRLAKIERGQIFPRPQEVMALAEALSIDPMDIFIDTVNEDFDRDAWAREHIEASLTFRGGSRADMRIGAAVRIRRRELGLSTTDLSRFKLPAATASRIENAERPYNRWTPKVHKSVVKLMGGSSMRDVGLKISEYEKNGILDETMAELFSPQSLDQRQNTSLLALVRKIPGARAEAFASKLERVMAERGQAEGVRSSQVLFGEAGPDIFSKEKKMPIMEGKTSDGWTLLNETDETFTRNFENPGIAFKLDKPVLGMGIPLNALLVFELIDRSEVAGNMVLALIDGPRVRVVSARTYGRGFKLEQADPEWKSSLSKEGDVRVAKLAQIELS